MDEKEIIYELGRWAPDYVLGLLGRLIEFHCFKCKMDFKGITAYEHYTICCPKLIEELRVNRRRRFGHVKQEGIDSFRTFGSVEKFQEILLLPLPRNDPKTVKEILSSGDVPEAVESDFEGFRK